MVLLGDPAEQPSKLPKFLIVTEGSMVTHVFASIDCEVVLFDWDDWTDAETTRKLCHPESEKNSYDEDKSDVSPHIDRENCAIDTEAYGTPFEVY
jgi:hypothetical protein